MFGHFEGLYILVNQTYFDSKVLRGGRFCHDMLPGQVFKESSSQGMDTAYCTVKVVQHQAGSNFYPSIKL